MNPTLIFKLPRGPCHAPDHLIQDKTSCKYLLPLLLNIYSKLKLLNQQNLPRSKYLLSHNNFSGGTPSSIFTMHSLLDFSDSQLFGFSLSVGLIIIKYANIYISPPLAIVVQIKFEKYLESSNLFLYIAF